MDSLLNAPRGRKQGAARGKKLGLYLVLGLIAVAVIVGVIVAWPRIFGPRGEKKPTDLLSGNPAETRTPDPTSAGGGATSTSGGSVSGGASSTSGTAGGASTSGSGTTSTSGGTAPAGTSTATTDGAASAEVAAIMVDANQKDAAGQAVEARKLYSDALSRNASPAQRAAIVKRLEDISGRTILGPRVVAGDQEVESYPIQSGDVLANIGRRFKIPYPLIKRLNNMPSDAIRAGQKLKVVKGPFRARVVKSTFTLELWLRGTLVKTYPVAIGTEDSTPAGTFEVTEKLEGPTFYPPESMRGKRSVIQGGHRDNPLGSRWIRFGEKSLGLGIHGTNEPQSIGKQVSLGCVRMLNGDVEFIYDCLIVGSQVEVVK